MRITPNVRKQAAMICDLAASAGWHYCDRGLDGLSASGGYTYENGPAYAVVVRHYGEQEFAPSALILAMKAFHYVSGPRYGGKSVAWTRAVDAEAAQLLREGWSPKKP